MSTRISWKKRPQLQKEFNDNDAYLTADNINEIVDGINDNYEELALASSELLSKINTNNTTLIDKNTNLSKDIQQLSTSIDNLKNINVVFNELSGNFNELSGNFSKLNSVTSSYYAVDAISADYATSAQNSQHAKMADVASIANSVLNTEVDRIISMAKDQISPGNGGTPATSLKSLIINNGTEQVIYNGSSRVEINSIYNAVSAEYSINAINSNNADIALSANMLTNKLIFKNTDNVITEFNGSTTVSLEDGINYATSSKYTLSANYAIDANEAVSASVLKNKIIFKNNNNQTCQFNGKTELDLSNGINYATNANEANIALTANKLSNNLTIVDADGTEYIYNGTTPIIINSISHAKTADSLTDTSQFNFSISDIKFPLTNDLSITYDGSEPIDLTDNLFAKQASVANSLKKSITFKTLSNSSNTFNGTNDLTIDSILSAKYSEYASYATCDGNGNIISDTYQPILKDIKYSYIVIIHGNEKQRLTNSTTNNTGVLSQHKKVQTFDFDKTYSLIINDNKIYPGGNTTISDPYKNGFNCNKALNSDYISDLNNISYTFILNKCCAAIANNKLYVWGRSDNYWYGLCDSNNLNLAISNNLSTPTYVQHFYRITNKSIYNKCQILAVSESGQTSTIDTTKIINNNLQQLTWEDLVDQLEEIEVGIAKIVKGGFGCGALAIGAENGKLYGCGKNKNQIFGRQFKNNCILKAWVELPVNDIINEKIVDIQSAHTDKTDVFMIRTISGRIYITGYIPITASVIKLPIFVSDGNTYRFSNALKIADLTPIYSISQNTIHCDPWYTGEIESINGWLNGWYCWAIASDTFSQFKQAAISPSGIAAINNQNLLYEGYDIFKSDQISAKYIFQDIQYVDDGQDQYLTIANFVMSNKYDIQLTKDSIFLKYENIIFGASLASPQLRNSTTSLLVDANTLHVQQIDEYENIQALKVNKCDDETILLILTNQSASQNSFDIRETLLNTGQAAVECLDINAAVIGLSARIDNSTTWTKFWEPNNNNYDVQYALYYTDTNALLKEQLVTVYNGMDTYAFDLISNNIYFTDMEYSDAGLTEIVLNTFDNSIISSKIYVLFSYIKPNTSTPVATPSSYVYEIPTSQQQTKSSIQLNLVNQVAGIRAISAMYQNSKTKNYEFFIFDGLSRENDTLYNPSSVTFDYAAFKRYFTE